MVLGRIRIIVSCIFYIKACISMKNDVHKLFKHFLALLYDVMFFCYICLTTSHVKYHFLDVSMKSCFKFPQMHYACQ